MQKRHFQQSCLNMLVALVTKIQAPLKHHIIRCLVALDPRHAVQNEAGKIYVEK